LFLKHAYGLGKWEALGPIAFSISNSPLKENKKKKWESFNLVGRDESEIKPNWQKETRKKKKMAVAIPSSICSEQTN
jgi:hypothetical protein